MALDVDCVALMFRVFILYIKLGYVYRIYYFEVYYIMYSNDKKDQDIISIESRYYFDDRS